MRATPFHVGPSILAACFCHFGALGLLSPQHHNDRPSRTQWKRDDSRPLQETKLHIKPPGSKDTGGDYFVKMVEQITNDQFSPDVLTKMSELEQVMSSFLDREKTIDDASVPPRPPGSPPPLSILNNFEYDFSDASLIKAEKALEKLRERLRIEEEALRLAEEALKQSMQDEEVLRRAEEALQRSREAAEQRKLEAMRQTEVAVASTEKARVESVKAEQAWDDHQIMPDTSTTDGSSTTNTEMEAPRSTISVDSLSGASPVVYTNMRIRTSDSDAPIGLPILYNWVQNSDGSIHAQVKNSEKFLPGSNITTSAVQQGAVGGSIVETYSGSKYYLEKICGESPSCISIQQDDELNSRMNSQYDEKPRSQSDQVDAKARQRDMEIQSQTDRVAEEVRKKQALEREQATATTSRTLISPKTADTPEGIPNILNWKCNEAGGISGFLYGSRNAQDGDYVQTSPIAGGVIESGSIVVTQSGSRYFLSPDETQQASNTASAFQDLVSAPGRGTITIPKEKAVKTQNPFSKSSRTSDPMTGDAMTKLESARPRSTFSLFDIFGSTEKKSFGNTNAGATGPRDAPTLTRWKENGDGTITGIISGSPIMNDGSMVTTSIIVSGTKERYQKVTTASGSLYYLG